MSSARALAIARWAVRSSDRLDALRDALAACDLHAVDALSGSTVGQSVSRAGEQSTGSLSGRPFIWSIIFISLSQFQPQHLVGFGAYGQVASGVSLQYAFLFPPTLIGASAHNTLLQLVLDTGYLGAALYLFLSWRVLSCLSTEAGRGGERGRWAAVGCAALVSLLVLGATDSTVSFGSLATLVLFFALNLHSLTSGVGSATGPVRGAESPDSTAHDSE